MKKASNHIDFIGGSASIACAVHCAILPILFSFGIVNSHHWLANPIFEIIIILFSALFLYLSLWRGFVKGTTSKKILGIACVGLILILTHHFLGQLSAFVVMIGGIMLGGAHFYNYRGHKQKA